VLVLLGFASSGTAQVWPNSYPQLGAPPPAEQRLAQNYNPWQFRPMPPTNARGVPLGEPQDQVPQGQVPPGTAPAYPSAQYPTSPYPAGQYPQAQPGMAAPYAPQGQPFGQAPRQYAPPGGYPQGQYAPPQYAPQYGGGQYPGSQYRGYGTQRSSAAQPRLEVVVDDDMPYVQENVLLHLKVISSGNLATASPNLTGYNDVLLETVDGPTTSTRSGEQGPEIVNAFTVILTPLRAGATEVGPLKVSGTLAGGVPFQAEAREALRLQVRPAMASVRPWLPLQALTLNMSLDRETQIEEGRPVTLTLEMAGSGAVGEQLPSLESRLQSQDFRVYREQTLTDTRLEDDGRRLLGTRTEYYTLVPHSGGRLHLPEIRIDWWNVETAQRETSGVPIRTVSVAGTSGLFGFTRSAERENAGAWAWVWMPLAGIGLLLLGYWGGVWLRALPVRDAAAGGTVPVGSLARRLPAALAQGVRSATAASGRGLTAVGRKLQPSRWMPQARALLTRLTPKATRVYHCASAVQHARTPAAWAAAFQGHACHHLQTKAREPLPRVADRIVDLRPGVNAERVRTLMQQLDTALYNGQPIDFEQWKRDFRRALRPGIGGLGSLVASRVRRGHLPELNPRPTAY
jgi:hypothetical protein